MLHFYFYFGFLFFYFYIIAAVEGELVSSMKIARGSNGAAKIYFHDLACGTRTPQSQ